MATWLRRPAWSSRRTTTTLDAPSSSADAAPSRRTRDSAPSSGPILQLRNLDVYYGRAHALQGVNLQIDRGVLGIVGRNGMGKTTLCNTITGLLPAIGSASGSVMLSGEELLGQPAHRITRRGIAYVPQGRRVWPSLSVDETLKLVATHRREVDRVYAMFPRLAERKANGGAQLSGGEQQMLAIGRALLLEPRLLVMDEPTEGLAPVIVEQVAQALRRLASEGEIAVLLIEQNLGVAIEVADNIGVMVNGRIATMLSAQALAADKELQERHLGLRSGGEDDGADVGGVGAGGVGAGGVDAGDAHDATASRAAGAANEAATVQVFTVQRAYGGDAMPNLDAMAPRARGFNRWNAGGVAGPPGSLPSLPPEGAFSGFGRPGATDGPSMASISRDAGLASAAEPLNSALSPPGRRGHSGLVLDFPVAAGAAAVAAVADRTERAAYVAGTFDTKAQELFFLRQCLDKLGLRVVTVDLSTSGKTSTASVHAREIARHHPEGERAVFSGDRGSAVSAMALAFERFILTRRDVGGIVSAGGSGGTSLATPAMRALPIGVPKVMVSSMASGDTRPYVGPSDICMMYSVTDVQGINRISEKVLANAAHALAGMIGNAARPTAAGSDSRRLKPAIGLTMFGVTTPCVQMVTKQIEADYDCLVFHATGVGGQSMEKLADSGLLEGVIDVTTTEVADEIVGGVLSAGPTRMDVFARHALPYVGSCGALDMVNFGAWDTVPERFKARKLYKHNPTVTLMRTTADECRAIGAFIVAKLNAMRGPVRFFIPEGGVSAIDKPGAAFHDPEADRVLFDTITQGFRVGADRKLVRLPLHVNEQAFADALVAAWREVAAVTAPQRHRATP